MPQATPATILVIGGGGREHALAWALARSEGVARVLVAPGNPGTAAEPKVENLPLGESDAEGLAAVALARGVALCVVGPEKPIEAGLVDRLRDAGLAVFGPSRAAARIETSKAWARDLMRRQGIPHPAYRVAGDPEAAAAAIAEMGGACVVKADGLAAGKGVLVCEDGDSALAAARAMLLEGRFGAAGARVLIEERVEGPELSVMAICDGRDFRLLSPAQDHKRLLDEDRGPNTGGMGAYAPAPIGGPELLDRVGRAVIAPALAGLREAGHPFVGCLFAGLMLSPRGPVVIEFNARFGDPETQVQLPLVESDLAGLLLAAARGDLASAGPLALAAERSAACVVLASGGYPEAYPIGLPIAGLGAAGAREGVKVFHAGTRAGAAGAIETAGGRVLGLVCVRPSLAEAVAGAYAAIGAAGGGEAAGVRFEGMVYRRDIAAGALAPAGGSGAAA